MPVLKEKDAAAGRQYFGEGAKTEIIEAPNWIHAKRRSGFLDHIMDYERGGKRLTAKVKRWIEWNNIFG